MLTLGEAAKEVGVAKSAISRAIKTGRLSAVRQENGSFSIDPAELFRVYPSNRSREQESERTTTPGEHSEQQREIAVLRELIEEIKGERDDLRNERDKLLRLVEEQAGTLKLLTYSPPQGPSKAWRATMWVLIALLTTILAYVVVMQFQLMESEPDTKPTPQEQSSPRHFWEQEGTT